ncbi:MAG TPA: PilZ domain-containing protein [Labilithrix sp.]|nr:PilZ domain-containing protein [Labilithrix sp.]
MDLRREARVDARIKVVLVRGKSRTSLETSDVSFKGLCFRTAEAPPLRSLLRLRVALPAREIEAHAMVVHISNPSEDDASPPAVGVQFWGLAGPDRTTWDAFVGELVQKARASAKRAATANAGVLSQPPPPPRVDSRSPSVPPAAHISRVAGASMPPPAAISRLASPSASLPPQCAMPKK